MLIAGSCLQTQTVIPNPVNESALVRGPHLRAVFAREWADQRSSRGEGSCGSSVLTCFHESVFVKKPNNCSPSFALITTQCNKKLPHVIHAAVIMLKTAYGQPAGRICGGWDCHKHDWSNARRRCCNRAFKIGVARA